MDKRTRIGESIMRVCLLVAVVGGLGLLGGGCFKADVNVPAEYADYARYIPRNGNGGGSEAPSQVGGRDRALRLARQAVRDEGLNPAQYETTATQSGNAWWVAFDHRQKADERGYPHHFAVRALLDGSTEIFRGR
jgi:hypothetical protein